MTLEEMNLDGISYDVTEVKISDALTLEVREFLTIDEKVKFIQYVIRNAEDDAGCFSPIRVEVFYGLALCKFYADIDIGEESPTDAYDKLEYHGIIDKVNSAIPADERAFIHELVIDTVQDVSRYNSSAAGIVHAMSVDSGNLNENLNALLEDIKNGEGLATFTKLKDSIVGNKVVVKRG